MREAICDTSPIQYLHQAGFLYLLFELYSRIVVPPAVVRELDRGKAIGVDLPDLRLLPWMEIRAPEKLHQNPATLDLGAGEREVLALGVEIPGSILILANGLRAFMRMRWRSTSQEHQASSCVPKWRIGFLKSHR
jgi:predicted nucleic acid-binding protein